MERFKKEKLIVNGQDSFTVLELKAQCNKLIEEYNVLEEPLSEQGLELSTQINGYLMKILQLKDSNYQNR